MRIRARSAIIVLTRGVTQVATLALAVVLVRIVSQETFGTYRQALLVYTTLVALLSLQLEQSLYYFVPRRGPAERRDLVLGSLLLTWAIGVLSGALLFSGARTIAGFLGNPDLEPLLRILALYPLLDRVTILIPAYMISLDRAVRAGVYAGSAAVSRAFVTTLFFAFGASLEAVFWAVLVTAGALAAVGSVDMLRLAGRAGWRPDRRGMIEQLTFAVPLWLTSAVGTLNVQYDKLLIARFFDSASYGVYFCGAIELPLIALVTHGLNVAVMPNLVGLTGERRTDEALRLWQAAIRKASLVIFPCFAFFLVISRDFIVLAYGVAYAAAAGPFTIYLLMLPLRVAVYATLFLAMGRTRPIAAGAVLSLVVNVVVSTALVILGRGTPLAFIGPSIGTVVATFAAVLYFLVRLRSALGTSITALMRWRELAATLWLSLICGTAVAVLPMPPWPLAATLVLRAAIFAGALALAFLVTRHLDADERGLISEGLARTMWRRRAL